MNKKVKKALKLKNYKILFELIENPKAQKYLKNHEILGALLDRACHKDNQSLKLIDLLFKLGANPNYNQNSLFLNKVLKQDNFKLFELFIKYKINLNIKNSINQNPIFIVASSIIDTKTKFKYFKVLIKFRVDVNCISKQKYSGIIWLFFEAKKSSYLLLKRGLSIRVGYKNKSILEYFSEFTKKKVDIILFRYLIQETSSNDVESEYKKVIANLDKTRYDEKSLNSEEIENKQVDSYIQALLKQRLTSIHK